MLQRIKFGLDVEGKDLVIELEEWVNESGDQYWIGYVVHGNKIIGVNDKVSVTGMRVLNMIEDISIEMLAYDDHYNKLMGDI
jgi:hypothetical protein